MVSSPGRVEATSPFRDPSRNLESSKDTNKGEDSFGSKVQAQCFGKQKNPHTLITEEQKHLSSMGHSVVPVRTKRDSQKEAVVSTSSPTHTVMNLGGKQLVKALFNPLKGRVEGETGHNGHKPFPFDKQQLSFSATTTTHTELQQTYRQKGKVQHIGTGRILPPKQVKPSKSHITRGLFFKGQTLQGQRIFGKQLPLLSHLQSSTLLKRKALQEPGENRADLFSAFTGDLSWPASRLTDSSSVTHTHIR